MIYSVEYHATTGWPNSQGALRRRVSAFVRTGRARRFKLGLTNDPCMRAGQHNLKKNPYSRMVVIYATLSQKNAQEIETWLIHMYRNRVENQRAGGAGRYGSGWKYVYALLS